MLTKRNRIKAYLLLTLSMLFVGVNIPIGKIIVKELPVFLLSEIRFLLAILILIPLLYKKQEIPDRIDSTVFKSLFWQAFFGVFLFSICMLYGVKLTDASTAGIITSTVPACTALFSYLLLREKMGTTQVGSILCSVMGIGFLTMNGSSTGEVASVNYWGNILVGIAVASESLFTIFAKKISSIVTPYQMATGVNIIGFLLFLPFACWELFHFQAVDGISIWTWFLVGYYSITASVLSFVFWYRGVQHVTANIAGLFTGVMPISAVVVSLVILQEQIYWQQMLGMAMVLIAIALGTKGSGKKQVGESLHQ